jgi:hypothetical protein
LAIYKSKKKAKIGLLLFIAELIFLFRSACVRGQRKIEIFLHQSGAFANDRLAAGLGEETKKAGRGVTPPRGSRLLSKTVLREEPRLPNARALSCNGNAYRFLPPPRSFIRCRGHGTD